MTYGHRVVGWRRARQEHEQLANYWRSSMGPTGARIVQVCLFGQHALEAMREVLDRSAQEIDADMIELALKIWATVRDAPTWSITPDMVTLIEHAAESMPSETMLRSDVPSDRGFVWLEEPIWALTDDGRTEVPLRAFHWNVHRDDQVDVIVYRGRDDLARGIEPEPPISPDDRHLVASLWPCSAFTWQFGEDAWPTTLDQHVAGSEWRARFLKALWTISQQTIAVTATPALARADRRRSERLQMPTEVIVVQLRRPKRPTHEDQASAQVEWTHRWVVSGHWRNQYLPSTGAHRLQYIAEHVKGPEDKPLVPKSRVFDVRR